MVALLVKLKLTLLRSSLRQSVWRAIGIIIGAAYGLGLAVGAVLLQAGLRFAWPEYAAAASILVLSLLTVGWAVMPLLTAGFDDTLDPGRFALLPVRARELLPGMVLAVLVGVPGVVTVLSAAGQLVVWSTGVAAFVAALVMIPVGIATCVVLSRVVVGLVGGVTTSRRYREVAGLILVLLMSSLGIVANGISEGVRRTGGIGQQRVTEIADIVGWTPVGWAWSVAPDVAAGRWAVAGARLLLAVLLLLVLLRVWEALLARALVSPLTSGAQASTVKAKSPIDRWCGPTPVGAIAARTLRYWRRDPRYLTGGLMALLLPVFILVPASAAGPDGRQSLFIAPLVLSLLASLTTTNDLSYDGSALWLHASSGIRGWQDRLGRVLVMAVLALPLVVVFLALAVLVTGRTDLAGPSAAAALALMLGGLAAGSWVGAYIQVPAPPPGANPFRTRSGGGVASLLSVSLTTAATVVLALPGLIAAGLSLWAVEAGRPVWGVLAVLVALGTGVGVVWLGVRQGGIRLDRRWPEVLTAVSKEDS